MGSITVGSHQFQSAKKPTAHQYLGGLSYEAVREAPITNLAPFVR
jgi:hypothetical protein